MELCIHYTGQVIWINSWDAWNCVVCIPYTDQVIWIDSWDAWNCVYIIQVRWFESTHEMHGTVYTLYRSSDLNQLLGCTELCSVYTLYRSSDLNRLVGCMNCVYIIQVKWFESTRGMHGTVYTLYRSSDLNRLVGQIYRQTYRHPTSCHVMLCKTVTALR